MYSRFFRWASDRLDKNGIITFVTNNSYIDTLIFDGFRKVVADEFSYIYILDLGGNARKREKGNVFGIKLGIAIAFMVKVEKKGKELAKIFYLRCPEFYNAAETLEYLDTTKLSEMKFEGIHPDKNNNWINQTENDWDNLLPVIDKSHKNNVDYKAIFNLFSNGVKTQRDDWVYDFSIGGLENKLCYMISTYQRTLLEKSLPIQSDIKWDRELTKYIQRGIQKEFAATNIIKSLYRPFTLLYLYFDRHFNGVVYRLSDIFRSGEFSNKVICVTDAGSEKPFMVLASKYLPDIHLAGAGAGTQCLPFFRFDTSGNRIENITDWALALFRKNYNDKKINKDSIFLYVYAVLHNPNYRKQYEYNLKREFPRIPYYEDFWKWVVWGKQLIDLHLNFEQAEKYPLQIETQKVNEDIKSSPRLIARKESGIIEIDTITKLHGVPTEVWEYRLGTYSALEWILERYKEKTPKDPTIREKFNTYRFGDYKEQVIDLLMRVCTVSVETIRIISQMPK
jgi:predicted helicase